MTYTMRVYNEGNVAGYAKEITDYLPEQLEFIQKKVAELSSIFMETVDSLSKSTDERIKLIEEKRQGLGKPNLIYVGKIQHENQEDEKR